MKRFKIVCPTYEVCEGVKFSDGSIAVRWFDSGTQSAYFTFSELLSYTAEHFQNPNDEPEIDWID